MSLIEAARLYREEKRLPSWASDRNVALGMASSFASSIAEHHDRWIFELLQNADDAGGRTNSEVTCKIVVSDQALVVADDGGGIEDRAVEELSNPFVSNKSQGTIGRKGVGFSAAYGVSSSPYLVSGGECLTFRPDLFGGWLESNPDLAPVSAVTEDYPYLYALVPFGLPAAECPWRDPSLDDWTQVCLPYRDDLDGASICDQYVESLQSMDFSYLLTFRHLREVVVVCRGAEVLRVRHESLTLADGLEGATGHRLVKSLDGAEGEALGDYACWSKCVEAPDEVLTKSIPDSRTRKLMKSTVVCAMAPLTERSLSCEENPETTPFLVFYPTEAASPTRTLLHAEFMVESNRKHVLSIEASFFNDWLLGEVSTFLVMCANNLSRAGQWKAALALLQPTRGSDGQDSKLAGEFWSRIQTSASDGLKLPTDDGGFAFLANLYAPSQIRDVASVQNLMALRDHSAVKIAERVTEDSLTMGVLRKLGCQIVTENDVLGWLTAPPAELPEDGLWDWIWSGWSFLADWRARNPKDERGWLDRVKLLPINGELHPRGIELCWETEISGVEASQLLPDWLPLRRLPGPLVHKIQEHENDPLSRVLRDLGIRPLESRHVLQALARAANHYWDKGEDERPTPGQFLHFLSEQPWLESALEDALYDVDLGAIPVRVISAEREHWMRANECYFGAAWGNDELALVYRDESGVPWLAKDPIRKRLFEGLGVESCPRLIGVAKPTFLDHDFWRRARSKMPNKSGWATNQEYPESRCKNRDDVEKRIRRMERVTVGKLDHDQQRSLLRLVFRHWASLEGQKNLRLTYSAYNIFQIEVENQWWWDLRANLISAQHRGLLENELEPLRTCWSPVDAPKWVKRLLPLVSTQSIVGAEERGTFNDWLAEGHVVRRSASETTPQEWEKWAEALVKVLPTHSTPDQRKLMTQFYTGYLESVAASQYPVTLGHTPCFGEEKPELRPSSEVWVTYKEIDVARWSKFIPIALVSRNDAKNANEVLGFRHLKSRERLLDSIGLHHDEKINTSIHAMLPYLYTYENRRVPRQERLPVDWKRLKHFTAKSVAVELSLDSDVDLRVEENWTVFGDRKDRRIVLEEGTAEDREHIALGLKHALGLSRETKQLAELLLGLDSPEKMRSRLRSEGIEDLEIDEGLSEFREDPDELRVPDEPLEKQTRNPSSRLGDMPTKAGGERAEVEASALDEAGSSSSSIDTDNARQEPVHAESDAVEVVLKSATAECVWKEIPASSPRGPNQGQGSEGHSDTSDESESTGAPLDESTRLMVEELSRQVIERRIREEFGDAARIIQMPRMNEGYDIEFEVHGRTVRIEAKGHQRSVGVEELTAGEFKCYKESKDSNYDWELWSVQNLAADVAGPITITRIRNIPLNAIAAKSFRVQLSECDDNAV